MIYNVVPQNTITAPLFGKLLEIENVVGIKQSVGGIMAFYEMKMVNGKRGKVFSATDDMLCSTYELGADGAISAILTVFPELCVEMWKDFKEGRRGHALELQNRMYFTWQAIAGSQFPIRIKYALRLDGPRRGLAARADLPHGRGGKAAHPRRAGRGRISGDRKHGQRGVKKMADNRFSDEGMKALSETVFRRYGYSEEEAREITDVLFDWPTSSASSRTGASG